MIMMIMIMMILKMKMMIMMFTISVLHNWYNDGVSWHDSACYRTKQFMCEDSAKMVNRAKIKHPNIIL